MASPNPKPLPGFYYDEDKGKYFKIIKGHHFASTGYTTEKVTNKKRELKLKSSERRKGDQMRQQMTLQHPVFGRAGLNRELDCIRKTQYYPFAWAAGMEAKTLLRDGGTRSFKDIEHFIYDRLTGALLYDTGHVRCQFSHWDDFAEHGSVHSIWPIRPSSMSLHPSRVLLLTTFIGTKDEDITPSGCYLRFLKNPTDYFDYYAEQDGADSTRTYYDPQIEEPGRCGQDFQMPNKTRGIECWTSAANPWSVRASFALGTSAGLGFLDERDGSFGFGEWRQPYPRGESWAHNACRALDWLDEKTVLTATVGGIVHLWDRRAQAGLPRIHFKSSISHCRRVDDNHVVIAGLENQLHSYDLRFTHAYQSKPYISYPEYLNTGHPHLGFDVSTDGSMIAAANDVTGVKIFDTASGIEIKTPSHLGIWNPMFGPCRCIKFVDGLQDDCVNDDYLEEDADELYKVTGPDVGLKLLVAKGNHVVSWGW